MIKKLTLPSFGWWKQ